MNINDEIIKIQEIISYQSHEISQLSDVIYAQQKEISDLKKQVQQLKADLEAGKSEDSPIKPLSLETKPPHY